ncbi:MAG TPA: NYN domain-containing protein [Kofleriaceae bacterium]
MKVRVYIDGFNLYYRALKDSHSPSGGSFKWLDPVRLAAQLLPNDEIDLVRYFTAIVRRMPDHPYAPDRQRLFLRALATLPTVQVHHGRFLAAKKIARLVTPLADGTKLVKVHKTEEKGSDVALATYLLLDGFRDAYEAAAVITNDSDLAEPIRVVRDELKKPIIVLEPCPDRPSAELKSVATATRPIRQGALGASQFPEELRDAVGAFHKPPSW